MLLLASCFEFFSFDDEPYEDCHCGDHGTLDHQLAADELRSLNVEIFELQVVGPLLKFDVESISQNSLSNLAAAKSKCLLSDLVRERSCLFFEERNYKPFRPEIISMLVILKERGSFTSETSIDLF